jgi:hypothetical protein
VDTTFNPAVNSTVVSFALQADGKILVGGGFTTLGGQSRSRIGRLNTNGTVDTTFNPGADGAVWSLALQADGKILVGGAFTTLGGQSRSYLGRLGNTGTLQNDLLFDGTSVTWLRGGTAPELTRATLEASSGGTWLSFGSLNRIAGGWQRTGLPLSPQSTIRVRGYLQGGYYNASSGIEEVISGGITVVSQPVSRTNSGGTVATFAVSVVGAAPIQYQWFKDGLLLLNGGKVSGSTNATLTVSNVSGAEVGSYSVVVSNAFGVTTSSVATLTVLAPPVITSQPLSQSVIAGANATFTVGAAGTGPIRYQWSCNGTNLAAATNASLILNGIQPANAGDYFVVVSNNYGARTSSPAATLTVIVPPSILTQPQSAAVLPGTNVTFSVAANGTLPLAYQWRRNGAGIANATNDLFNLVNIQSANAGDYTVVVANEGGSVTSAVAVLTVLGPPVIISGPVSQAVQAGATVNFSVVTGGSAPLGYQWQFNGTNMPGQTASTLSLPAVQPASAGDYTVVVTNTVGSVTSAPPATLTVITFAASQASLPVYQSPGPFTVSCRVDYALDRTLFFMSWQPALPAGWTLQSASGDANPSVSGGQVVFSGALPNPLNFTYTVAVPAGQTGSNSISGGALYFLSGMSSTAFAPATPSPLVMDHGSMLLLQRSGGSGVLTFLGDGGGTYTIQTSTNLPVWQDAWNLNVSYGPIQTNLPMTNRHILYRSKQASP